MPNANTEEANSLKKYLKRGDMKILSAELGVSRIAIYYATSGQTKECDYILNAVVALAKKRKDEQADVINRLKKL